MLLSHLSYSMLVASAEERKEGSHENWALNCHHPPSDVDVSATALHVYVAGTEVFIHTHTNITDGYNYWWGSCSPNLKVSKNRLCCLPPLLVTTHSHWTTPRPVSPSGEGGQGTATPHPTQHTSLGMGTCSPPKQDGHASNHHHFKGERAYLALQSLIQKDKNNQMCFETCLLPELRQTRVDLTLKLPYWPEQCVLQLLPTCLAPQQRLLSNSLLCWSSPSYISN